SSRVPRGTSADIFTCSGGAVECPSRGRATYAVDGMFLVIFVSILALDGLFWWWADRRARRLPRPTAWRVGVAIFVGLQLGVLGAMILLPGLRHAAHHY